MSQVVSRRPVTSEARLPSQASLCGICCEQSGSETGFSSSTPVFGDSSVVIATRYMLDGPGIETWWGDIFRTRPDTPSLLCNGYRVFPGGKAAGEWRWLPSPSSAEVKERVEVFFCSPSGPSWPVILWNLPLALLQFSAVSWKEDRLTHLSINLRRYVILSIDSHSKILRGLYIFYVWETDWREENGMFLHTHL